MHINIKTLMAFRVCADHVDSLEELERRFPIHPAGTLIYYDIGDVNVGHFTQTGKALNDNHCAVLDNLTRALQTSTLDAMTFELVLGPARTSLPPFVYVARHLDLLRALAAELRAYRVEAGANGKQLSMIVRYASEMNASGDENAVYAGDPAGFRSSFAQVRRQFRSVAPEILFPFSPALRADLDVQAIDEYWPGDEFVDIVGATWYVHGEAQYRRGIAHMRSYFQRQLARDRPFAIDEFGGAEGSGEVFCHNDAMLERMIRAINRLERDGISFDYGTLFFDDQKYGVDATLAFLKGRSPT